MTKLRSAIAAVEAWDEGGGTREAALTVASQQVDSLDDTFSSQREWTRLVEIARRTIDPWFATDWPETFDALMLVLPLCRTFDWQCAKCPIGRQQDDRACAHPEVPVTRLGTAVSAGERGRAQTELAVLRSMLTHA
ncbi:MAG: hypothetical protein KUG77_26785 [Nannocystaceae bacterium]|nr:hypothetical protein [Nannocystaceae bacterium]